tara:strand:- start:103 stop:312 length:210 start_codon:yes stop_codon:yes gene_type:complete
MNNEPTQSNQDELNSGLQVLSFCFPFIGGIIWLSNKSNSPKKAKSACHAALWGMGLGLLMQIFATIGGA